MRGIIMAGLGVVLSILLAGCQMDESEEEPQNERVEVLNIYTTIFPLEDFVQKIGGDFVKVESIYPPNVDAHTYEPTANELIQLADSDAFIYSGVGIEGFAETAEDVLTEEDVIVVAAGEDLELLEGEGHDHEHHHEDSHHDEDEHHAHDHGDQDPHVWLDPILSIELAASMKDLLVELLPEQEEVFLENFEALSTELEQLDTEFQSVVDQADRKEILVSHKAYGYWENRYGIEQVSVLGFSSTDEPSQQELIEIVNVAEENNIQYILFEENVSNNIAEIIQDQLGIESLVLKNMESISEEDRASGEDYFSLMRHNLEILDIVLHDD